MSTRRDTVSAGAKRAVQSAARRTVLSRRVRDRLLASSAFRQWISTDPDVRGVLAGEESFRAPFHVETRVGADAPPARIDVEVTPPQLTAAFERVRQTWETVGVDEPHWSVLSADEFKSEQIDDTRSAFYDSGEFHVDQLVATLHRHGIDPGSVASCLEFGCGVGRMTIWLAQRFAHVTGCDISQPHLDLARAEIEQRRVDNVDLLHVGGQVDLDSIPSADLIYSVIVLQHNPPPIMAHILRRLLDSLRPGGHAVIQLPTFDERYAFSIDDYLEPDAVDGILMHVLPQADVFTTIRDAGCELREVYADHLAGMEPKTMSNTFVIAKPV